MKAVINVLIVEDSATIYTFLQHVLQSQPDINVIGWAKNGQEAIEKNQLLQPDLILMDFHLPVLNGLEATRQIMTIQPTPIILCSATSDPNDISLSLEALRCGAMALIEKPATTPKAIAAKSTQHMLKLIRALSEVKTVRLRAQPQPAEIKPTFPNTRYKLVVIAASTGGPQALALLLAKLTKAFPVPLLLVQHIGEEFCHGFVSWLEDITKINVKTAQSGEPVQAGTLYVAPAGHHLGINQAGHLFLSDAPPLSGFRPSADFTFSTAATAYGNELAAIILTGMGEDGVNGLRQVQRHGGFVIAQNNETSVVYGMPRAAQLAGVVNEVLSLQQIEQWLLRLQ